MKKNIKQPVSHTYHCMNCLFDRSLTSDLDLHETHSHHSTFSINRRIQVRVYNDSPFYLALFCVDDIAILKEVMIGNVAAYVKKTQADLNFHSVLLEITESK